MRKFAIIVLLTSSSPALAYIGPGTSVGLVATVFGVISAIVLSVLGLIYYPIKRLWRKIINIINSK